MGRDSKSPQKARRLRLQLPLVRRDFESLANLPETKGRALARPFFESPISHEHVVALRWMHGNVAGAGAIRIRSSAIADEEHCLPRDGHMARP